MFITDEQFFGFMGGEYERKGRRIVTPPTAEDMARYEKAKAAFKVLEEYEWMEWGGPDYGTEVEAPRSRVTYEYLETVEEWLDRCRALYKEGTKA